MKLYEYQAMSLFKEYGIPVPLFEVIDSPRDAESSAEEIGLPVVLKAQVLVGGRGKAGGIKVAHSLGEVKSLASTMLMSEIRGELVKRLVVAEAVEVERELYLSATLEKYGGNYLFMASPEGGVDIEEVAKGSPEKIVMLEVDPLVGIREYHMRAIARRLDIPPTSLPDLMNILKGLFTIFKSYNCELAEINPLALTNKGNLIALDAKVIIDDNALRVYPHISRLEVEEVSGIEGEARRHGFSYVEMDGDIGIIGNGAGLTMTTMDLIKFYGGRPANFLDIGGGADAERVYKATSLLLKHHAVKVLFVNVLGGITRCDEVAKGLVRAMKESGAGKRLVVRLVGTREEEGRAILTSNGYEYFSSMDEAAKKAIELSKMG
ncbi:MAG: ADP-forming succinate--CoA ligase subunit beta [Aigarchaeota archaeon]|nr:ADP-forming succinate--CoA ligase subunit beta [Aigarchaeota archaeon]MDW8092882.1 ADP-forming succinate--CoA ligase subunit beta [Nitrososphaerota archaeon]